MTGRRTAGNEGLATKTAVTPTVDASSAFYAGIFQNSPFGVFILHLENPEDAKTFRIIDCNPAAAKIASSTREELSGKTLAEFPRLLKTSFPGQCQEVCRTRQPRNLGAVSYGDEHIRRDTYGVQVFPLFNNYLGVSVKSLSDHNRTEDEDEVRESGERLRLLIQGVQEYAIFQLDPLGHVVSWNAGAERLKGYRAEEVIGKHFSIFYSPEDVASGTPERILEQAVARGHSENDGWRIRKDGSRFWANVVISALRGPQGTVLGFVKLTRDMTERREKEETLTKAKETLELRVEQRTAVLERINQELRTEIADRRRAEDQLKSSLHELRALAARLQNVREEERTSVAREIHDELGQACTAIKMDLSLIAHKVGKRDGQLGARVAFIIKLVDDMIFTLRRIGSELRPRALDDLGLTAALEWQAQEFQSRTGIPCHITLSEDPLLLDSERSTAVFRIFQESLTNIARHADATRVEASLERERNDIVFQVSDNGRGFDIEEVKGRRSLGLVGMQERALVLNGELEIRAVPGAGTTLTLRIPLPPSPPTT